jgi:c-di-GMP-related signal transduction protein
VVNALSEIGLEHLVGQSRARISVSPEYLSLDLACSLPPERVVLQLDLDFVKVDMAALGARELAHQRFRTRAVCLTLVAQNVETPEDFRLAKAAGAPIR